MNCNLMGDFTPYVDKPTAKCTDFHIELQIEATQQLI